MSKKQESQADQSKRFIETARELGCDEDEAAFDEKLKRIARARPKPLASTPKQKPPRSRGAVKGTENEPAEGESS
jgi:hypothetical protein